MASTDFLVSYGIPRMAHVIAFLGSRDPVFDL